MKRERMNPDVNAIGNIFFNYKLQQPVSSA